VSYDELKHGNLVIDEMTPHNLMR